MLIAGTVGSTMTIDGLFAEAHAELACVCLMRGIPA
jgi:hypothetical protein